MSSPALRLRSRPYRASAPVDATTEDGVPLAGARVGRDGPTLVFLHGRLGWHRKVRIVRFVEALARRFVVYAFDLRGHGARGGTPPTALWRFSTSRRRSLGPAPTGPRCPW